MPLKYRCPIKVNNWIRHVWGARFKRWCIHVVSMHLNFSADKELCPIYLYWGQKCIVLVKSETCHRCLEASLHVCRETWLCCLVGVIFVFNLQLFQFLLEVYRVHKWSYLQKSFNWVVDSQIFHMSTGMSASLLWYFSLTLAVWKRSNSIATVP